MTMQENSRSVPKRSASFRRSAGQLAHQQSVVSLASFGISLIAVTALVVVLLHVLGAKSYGAWVLTGGIVNYIAVFDFGMSLTIARYVALGFRGDRAEAEEAITVGLGVVGLVGLIVALAVVPIAPSWQNHLGVGGSAFALRAAGPALLALLLSKVLQSALEGAGKVGLSRAVQAASQISFTTAAATAVFFTSKSLEVLSLILVANSVAVLLVYGVLLAHAWGWRMPLRWPSRVSWKRVVGYALTMQGGSLLALSVDPVSRFLLGVAAGPAAVAPLDIALRTSTQFFSAALAFTRPVLPMLGHFGEDRDAATERATDLWSQFVAVAVASGTYLAVVVYFAFPAIFGSIGHRAGVLSAIGVLLFIPGVLGIIPYLYIVVYGTARSLFVIQAVNAAVAIVLTLLLVWWLGSMAPVLGIGLGLTVSSVLMLAIAKKTAEQAEAFALGRAHLHDSVRAVAATLFVGGTFFLPVPVAVRIVLASIIWLVFSLTRLRELLRIL